MSTLKVQDAMVLALERHKAGKLAEAEAIYRRVLQLEPRHPDALNLLGLLMGDSGRLELAVELLTAAISSNPTVAQFHANLGEMNRRTGRMPEAAQSLQRALEIDPRLVDIYNTLGVVLKSLGKSREAISAFSQAVQRAPHFAEAQYNLGLGLRGEKQFKEAVAPLRKAVELKPHDIEAQGQLGMTLFEIGEIEEAEAILRSVVAKAPQSADAHNNLGSLLYQTEKLRESIVMYRNALELDPKMDHVHWNLAIALLRSGDLPNGWPEYEWRLKNRWSVLKTPFPQPRWDGGPLDGKTILLHTEQGFGDTLQFIRYLPTVAEKGGKIVLRCQPELVRLLEKLPKIARMETDGFSLGPFDVYCPLLSLPLIFGTTLETIPGKVPYIKANKEIAASWAKRLGRRRKSIRVGLAWAGSRAHRDDEHRSIDLVKFAPLAVLANLELHSLQKGPAGEQAKNLPENMKIADHAAEIDDFADLAGLMDKLDLVISVDTAVAHLAGAMGKPVWVLLPVSSDWRWMTDRTDSPWYPTMRLFRQKRGQPWEKLIADVAKAASTFERGAPAV
jgi:tetratricopeptide (TPR) repeat protein